MEVGEDSADRKKDAPTSDGQSSNLRKPLPPLPRLPNNATDTNSSVTSTNGEDSLCHKTVITNTQSSSGNGRVSPRLNPQQSPSRPSAVRTTLSQSSGGARNPSPPSSPRSLGTFSSPSLGTSPSSPSGTSWLAVNSLGGIASSRTLANSHAAAPGSPSRGANGGGILMRDSSLQRNRCVSPDRSPTPERRDKSESLDVPERKRSITRSFSMSDTKPPIESETSPKSKRRLARTQTNDDESDDDAPTGSLIISRGSRTRAETLNTEAASAKLEKLMGRFKKNRRKFEDENANPFPGIAFHSVTEGDQPHCLSPDGKVASPMMNALRKPYVVPSRALPPTPYVLYRPKYGPEGRQYNSKNAVEDNGWIFPDSHLDGQNNEQEWINVLGCHTHHLHMQQQKHMPSAQQQPLSPRSEKEKEKEFLQQSPQRDGKRQLGRSMDGSRVGSMIGHRNRVDTDQQVAILRARAEWKEGDPVV